MGNQEQSQGEGHRMYNVTPDKRAGACSAHRDSMAQVLSTWALNYHWCTCQDDFVCQDDFGHSQAAV